MLGPDWIVDQYCWDVDANNSHAEGYVYQNFSFYYTVSELETLGLWTTLSQRATELGLPCGGM